VAADLLLQLGGELAQGCCHGLPGQVASARARLILNALPPECAVAVRQYFGVVNAMTAYRRLGALAWC
jgi:hypothetical protein